MTEQEFNRHYGLLNKALRHYVGGIMGYGHPFLDDVVSDSFVSAWTNRDSFDESKSKFCTWLFTIGRNKAFSHMRKRCNNSVELKEQLHEIEIEEEYQEIDGSLLEVKLRKSTTLSNERNMSIFKAFYIDRKSYEEITVEHGVTMGVVKSVMRRSRIELGFKPSAYYPAKGSKVRTVSVNIQKKGNRFFLFKTVNSKRKYVGTFGTLLEAEMARDNGNI